MIKAKGKIKKGKRKNGGAWLIAPDVRNVGHVKISVTEEDAEVAELVGTNGHGVLERLDRVATLIDMVSRVKAVKSRLILTTSQ